MLPTNAFFLCQIFGGIIEKHYLCSRFRGCVLFHEIWIVRDEESFYGGLSSVGRASDCGSECRGFEPHIPPKAL